MKNNLFDQKTRWGLVGETDVKSERNIFEGLLHATACREAEVTTNASRAAVAFSGGNFMESSFAEDDLFTKEGEHLKRFVLGVGNEL